MTSRIVADASRCMGSGNCVELAPDHFTQGEDTGLVELLSAQVAPDDLEAVERAAVICPAGAIRVENQD